LDGINHIAIKFLIVHSVAKTVTIVKIFKIQDQLVYVKLVRVQKLGPYLLMFVNINVGVNPDVAYVYVRDGTL
jgi:hypothetical protein